MLDTLFLERLSDVVLKLELLLQFRTGCNFWRRSRFFFEPRTDGVICKLRFVANEGGINCVTAQSAISGYHELDDHCRSVLVFEQR